MLCTNCGQDIPEGAPFCGNCGAPAPQAAGQTPPPPDLTQVPPAGAGQAPPPPMYAQAPPPFQPAPGYGAGWQPPHYPPTGGKSRTGVIVGSVIAALIVLAGLGVGLYYGLRDDDSGPATAGRTTTTEVTDDTEEPEETTTTEAPTTTTEGFVQREGEIFLEPIGTAGPDSFTGETFVSAPGSLPTISPTVVQVVTATTLGGPGTTIPGADTTVPGAETTAPGPTTTLGGPATTAGGVQVVTYPGGKPALYGGSKDKLLVDKEGQLTFFEQNPDKAAAFCAALNADPTFKWSQGTQVQPNQLRAFFEELTPLMLVRDIRVTNHGFRDGKPTPRQSVLQAGQMVLVDIYGVPRVRCECGNPLTPPQPVQKTPVYTGPKWPTFDPTGIIVISFNPVIIEDFTVVDVETGENFDRPTGTEGEEDAASEPTVWELAVSVEWYGDWTAEIYVDSDGGLSGSTPVSWHLEGTTTDGDGNETGTWAADVSFALTVTGTVEPSELGRVLHIQPSLSGLDITNVVYDTTGDVEALKADLVNTDIPGWVNGAMVALDIEVVDWSERTATFSSPEGFSGSATLTAIE